jgi:hypothetical protein
VTGYSQDLKGSRQGIIHGIPEKCKKTKAVPLQSKIKRSTNDKNKIQT